MLKNYMGIINLDENEDRIKDLTRRRPLASIPIAGRYRIIDFILSNMTNAGIQNIGIFTKTSSRSLIDHLGDGRPWDLDRKYEGARVFNFSECDPVYDDVHVFGNNLEYFIQSKQENVILSSSHMICNLDFNEVIKYHEEAGNDITIVYKQVENADTSFYGCDVLDIEGMDRIIHVGENIGGYRKANICMEMYIMKKSIFMNLTYESIRTGRYKKIKKAIYETLESYKIGAYEHKGYLSCINSLYSYYTANMDFLDTRVSMELFFKNPIYTKVKDESPTKYTKDSHVVNSIISSGCVIEGTVENSIISRRVHISKGAVLKNCIILQNCEICENARLYNIITDKRVVIEGGKELRGDKDIPLVIERTMLG